MDGAFAAARMYQRSSPAAHVADAARVLIDAHIGVGSAAATSRAVTAMFESLDFVYVPTRDVDAAAAQHVRALGAEPLWIVRAMDTTVAALRAQRHRAADPAVRPMCSGWWSSRAQIARVWE